MTAEQIMTGNPVSRFIGELHRRRVFATAGLYLVGAWLVMQAGDVFFPGWGIPDRGINLLLVAAVSGFPLALVFGWLFNITAQGIRRSPRAGSDEIAVSHPLRGGDYFILAALLLASGVIITRVTVEILAIRSDVPPSIAVEKLPNSIAVLPFTNMSSDPENGYFCDGVSEEILNRLAKYTELNVIGRTSSWQFKGSDRGIRSITDMLGVYHLLRGSVQKVGDKLRITARLVDDAGTQVWSETFDRTLEDVFTIQSQIAEFVATAVVPKVAPQTKIAYKPDLAAYDHFLRGREYIHRRDVLSARRELRQAVELDPGFAEAYAELAISMLIGAPDQSAIEMADDAIDTALTLVPGMPRALAARGLLFSMQESPDHDAAETVLRQALEQEPHMVDAMNWLAGALNAQGKNTEAYALYYRAHGYDPLHPAIAVNLAQYLVEKGDLTGAENMLLPLLQAPAPSYNVSIFLRELYKDSGQLVKMYEFERTQVRKGDHMYYGLALSYAMLGMWKQADYWVDRSIRDFPDSPFIVVFPSLMDRWRGHYAAALQALNRTVAASGTDPEDLFWYVPIRGFYLAMAGDYQEAVEVLQPYFEVRRVVNGNPWEPNAGHALAFALQRIGENDRAATLLESIEDLAATKSYDSLFNKSSMVFFLARNAALLGDRELALQRLRMAIDAGWRGYYINDSDPRWGLLNNDPLFRAMMAEVKADADRQREVVEKLDAEQDLPDLVDEARAERDVAVH